MCTYFLAIKCCNVATICMYLWSVCGASHAMFCMLCTKWQRNVGRFNWTESINLVAWKCQIKMGKDEENKIVLKQVLVAPRKCQCIALLTYYYIR